MKLIIFKNLEYSKEGFVNITQTYNKYLLAKEIR